ncbi:MAG: alpha-glucan family phosphorylase [Anaerolineales bacterium]|nr:alpha-glucan family phosphorylase [Anaerolineales bacterium]MCW5855141.1 alpha-glucan family phosphorylase [Anaerolineales bacterium]
MSDFHARQPNHFNIPERIRRLGELSYNLWWTWSQNARDLFDLIDNVLWEQVGHNPVLFLRNVPLKRLEAAARDLNYVDLYDATLARFDAYIHATDTWFQQNCAQHDEAKIAYFSTEFGLHETLPMYAGGLGVLAGDHLKEASDLGLPMVAMGFIYTQGYFFQHISEDGWQEARRVTLRFEDMPVMPLVDADGRRLTVEVQLPGRTLHAQVWEVRVGRVPLYLLDSNVESNTDTDRHLTARLYSSEMDLRISQEIVLGIGGVRALRKLGYQPNVWHMNEGHSAFLSLEQARELVATGMPLEQAVQQLRNQNLFTTHTPVPAGNDEFPLWLVDQYFSHYWPELGLDQQGFIDLAGRVAADQTTFSMPILALRFSAQHNGVSELHGRVARRMWNFLWPEVKEDEVKIRYVTNGVHTDTWLSQRLAQLLRKHLGKQWHERLDDPKMWDGVLDIPDAELWRVRRHLKRRMGAFIRERARKHWIHDGVHPVQTLAAGVMLDPYALTIGFARRFATYKRADLVLSDIDRLLRLLNRPNRPVQIIFAGKAHPADEGGKLLIQEVYRVVKKAETGGRLVFLEDYDMNVARYLVQGVDVWLNTPRRPMEASGTSGQKAALNGALNFSVLDGWWREGYNGKNGWVIGKDEDIIDPNEQDASDAASLYDVLENQIVPLYYQDRLPHEPPPAWLAMVKESIRTLAPQFSARRMLKEYVNSMYLPAIENPDQFLEG